MHRSGTARVDCPPALSYRPIPLLNTALIDQMPERQSHYYHPRCALSAAKPYPLALVRLRHQQRKGWRRVVTHVRPLSIVCVSGELLRA